MHGQQNIKIYGLLHFNIHLHLEHFYNYNSETYCVKTATSLTQVTDKWSNCRAVDLDFQE